MKRSLLFLSLILLSLQPEIHAQSITEGVYLSADDFKNLKISFANNRPGKKYQLHLNEFFNTSSIKVIIGDSVITLSKDSIYGYCNKNGITFRFYKKTAFEILNPSERILLYSYTSGVGPPRNRKLVTNYYFSETAVSPIYPLTKWNLKAVNGKDAPFDELLDLYFHFDEELTAYDSINKIYFLNRVYEESKLESEERHNKIKEYESKCSIFNIDRN